MIKKHILLRQIVMSNVRWLTAAAIAPVLLIGSAVQALACVAPERRVQTELRPALIGNIGVWPDRLGIGAGALLSLQLPRQATVEITGVSVNADPASSKTAVAALDEAQFRALAGSAEQFEPRPQSHAPLDAHEWKRFGGAYAGEARLTIRSGKLTKVIAVTVSATQPAPRGRLITATEQDAAAGRPLTPDGYDLIQLTVPGSLQDDWRVTPVEGTGFRWTGMQLLLESTPNEPRVRLDFVRDGSPKDSDLVVTRRQGDRHVFRIAHRSTVTGC